MGYLLSFWHPTFTQGLVLGQLSVLILLVLVLKYLFLESQSPPTHPYSRQQQEHLPTTVFPTAASKFENGGQIVQDEPESSEWLTFLLREIVQTYRSELRAGRAGPEGDESARLKIEWQLNLLRPVGFVDEIVVHSVDLGSSAPHLSNARIRTPDGSSNGAPQQIEFDVTYADTASISFSTSVLFNYPFPYFARLPVSLKLSLALFSSKVLVTPPRPASPIPTLTVALLPDSTALDLHISSLLGSRAKLADVPKLHEMIEAQIKRTLADRGAWTIVLPGLTTRLQQGGGVEQPHAADGGGIDGKLVRDNDVRRRPPEDLRPPALSI